MSILTLSTTDIYDDLTFDNTPDFSFQSDIIQDTTDFTNYYTFDDVFYDTVEDISYIKNRMDDYDLKIYPQIGNVIEDMINNNNSISFDGLTEYGLIENYTMTDNLSIGFWINVNSTQNETLNRILQFQTANKSDRLIIQCNANLMSIANFRNGINVPQTYNYNLQTNRWNHIIITYEKLLITNQMSLYLNGILVLSVEVFMPTENLIYDCYIFRDDGLNNYLKGSLDSLFFTNKTLTAEEVNNIYSNPRKYYVENDTGKFNLYRSIIEFKKLNLMSIINNYQNHDIFSLELKSFNISYIYSVRRQKEKQYYIKLSGLNFKNSFNSKNKESNSIILIYFNEKKLINTFKNIKYIFEKPSSHNINLLFELYDVENKIATPIYPYSDFVCNFIIKGINK